MDNVIRLTNRQQEILDFIKSSLERDGYPPTRQEIVEHFGFRSPTAAVDHLKALEKKGAIVLQAGISRGIQVAGWEAGGSGTESIPVVGRVAAGSPILAQENIEDDMRFNPDVFSPRPHYFLRVQGMSMRDAGILDGDLLAVHRTPEVRNGQIVVARIEDEVTVKRFRQSGKLVHLLPENPDFSVIVVDLETTEMVIEGLAVGVLRTRVPTKH